MGFTSSLSSTICNVFGICLATLKHDGLLIRFPVNLHASQGPYFCVEIGSLNFLLTDRWLRDSLCTHLTLYALSFCPFEQHCCFRISCNTDDQMGMPMETLLGSLRRYVPKGLSREIGTGRRRPELHPRRRKQEQCDDCGQVM